MPSLSRPLSVARRFTNLCFIGLAGLAAILVLTPLAAIFGYLVYKGVGALNWDFLLHTPRRRWVQVHQTEEEFLRRIDEELLQAQDADTGETYYNHWLATLEKLIAAKGAASPDLQLRYRNAWDHAADRTPHGQPIELTPDDFGD